MVSRLCCLLLLVAATLASGPLGALPLGSWEATPDFVVDLGLGTQLVANKASLSTWDGTTFSYVGLFGVNRPGNPTLILSFNGSAVCATDNQQLVISVDESSCRQGGDPRVAPVCDYTPQLYSGVFSYGTGGDEGSARATLIIDRWSGSPYPVIFQCADNVECSTSVACNTSTTVITNLYQEGGTAIVNGSQTVILNTNNTAYFQGDEITIGASSPVTIQQSNTMNQTIVNMQGEQTTVVLQAPNSTFYEVVTTEATSCKGYAQLEGLTSSNVTLTTLGYSRIAFDSSSFDAPADWTRSPDISTLEYTSADSGYAFSLQACLRSALLYAPSAVGQRLLVALYNRTGGSPAMLDSPAASAVYYNHTNPSYVTSVCTGPVLVASIYEANRFAIYASLDMGDGSTAARVLGSARWSLTATPVACKGVDININITAEFNDSQLQVGDCLDVSYPDSKTIRLDNPGMCGPEDTDTVTWEEVSQGIWKATCTGTRTNGTSCAGLCGIRSTSSYITTSVDANRTAVVGFEGVGSLPDTPTIDWTQTSTGVFEGQVRAVTANGLTCAGLCNAQSSSSYVTATVSGRNLTLGFTGVGNLQNSDTIVWTQVSPRVYSGSVSLPASQNLSQCASCGENNTLNVEKLCATQQCEVRADPPVSDPVPGLIILPCFGCGPNDGDGSDSDGGSNSDGSSNSGPPFVPFVPLPLPFFPPIVPFVPIAPGGSPGGGENGQSPNPPGGPQPAFVPVTTTLPPGVTLEPNTTGGIYLPVVNFTNAIIYCGQSTKGLEVYDNSTLPWTKYACIRTANGTYAWVPYCACSTASSNSTLFYYATTVSFLDGSTLYISNSSQLLVYGATYLGGDTYVAGNLSTWTGSSLDTCNATSVRIAEIQGCGGMAVALPDGMTVSSALTVNASLSNAFVSSTLPLQWTAPSMSFTSPSGIAMNKLTVTDLYVGAIRQSDDIGSPVPLPDGLETPYATVCPAGSEVTRIKTLGGCSGFPVNMPDGFSTTAPSTTNAALSVNGPLTITDASTFSISGLPAPLFISATSPFLYWVPLQSSGTICPNYIVQPAWQAFSVTVLRIANSKFLFWNWGVNRGAFPYAPPLLQFTGGACTSVTFSTSSAANDAYALPLAYRPGDDFFSATDTYDNANGGQYFYAYYTALSSSDGTLSIEHPTQPTSVFPNGTFRFLPNTYTYL